MADGESMWTIAKSKLSQELGREPSDAEVQQRTQQIMEVNQGLDPRALKVGDPLKMPGAGQGVSEATVEAYKADAAIGRSGGTDTAPSYSYIPRTRGEYRNVTGFDKFTGNVMDIGQGFGDAVKESWVRGGIEWLSSVDDTFDGYRENPGSMWDDVKSAGLGVLNFLDDASNTLVHNNTFGYLGDKQQHQEFMDQGVAAGENIWQMGVGKWNNISEAYEYGDMYNLTKEVTNPVLALGTAVASKKLPGGMFDGPDKVESFSTNAAFDGKLYPDKKIDQLVPYLEKRGVTVMETKGNPSFSGNWDATGVMKLPANPTELQVKHELSHFIDFKNQINQAPTIREGVQSYVDMGRLGREQSVLDHLQNNRVWSELNNMERSFSIDYVERLRIERGQ